MSKIYDLIIIGSGPAGLTAGVYASRADLEPLIIEGEQPGGQLIGTSYVENWPGEKSILGPKLMMNMKDHAQATGCSFLATTITRVDFSQQPFRLWTKNNEELATHTVIISTGATPNKLGCPGEEQYWGKGVTTCAICDGVFYRDLPVIIVGGGDTAMEDASFLSKITNDITIIHIKDALTASKAMQEKVVNNPSIKIIYNSTVTEIKGDGSFVTSVIVTSQKTNEQTELKTRGVFLAIGLRPQTELFKGQLNLDQWGYIQVTDHTKTSVPGIFAAGDVADFKYRQAVTSAGTGCMAALDAERFLVQSK